jgi:hypothetical protein
MKIQIVSFSSNVILRKSNQIIITVYRNILCVLLIQIKNVMININKIIIFLHFKDKNKIFLIKINNSSNFNQINLLIIFKNINKLLNKYKKIFLSVN